jgi:hypothetical protein
MIQYLLQPLMKNKNILKTIKLRNDKFIIDCFRAGVQQTIFRLFSDCFL